MNSCVAVLAAALLSAGCRVAQADSQPDAAPCADGCVVGLASDLRFLTSADEDGRVSWTNCRRDAETGRRCSAASPGQGLNALRIDTMREVLSYLPQSVRLETATFDSEMARIEGRAERLEGVVTLVEVLHSRFLIAELCSVHRRRGRFHFAIVFGPGLGSERAACDR